MKKIWNGFIMVLGYITLVSIFIGLFLCGHGQASTSDNSDERDSDSISLSKEINTSSESNTESTENYENIETTHNGKTIYTGPRGGKYYYSKSGKKVYI